MINGIDKAIAEFIKILPKITPLKIVVLTLCICACWFVYNVAPTVTNFVGVMLEDAHASKLKTTVSKENVSIVNRYITNAVEKDQSISMITVFQFVPSNDNFYQGRMLVTSASANKSITVDEYNLKWLPISAFRVQINKILNHDIYYDAIHDILYKKLSIDNKINRADYDSPINFNLMYSTGVRYMVSVPIVSTRVVGLVTVYFTNEPKNDAELQQQIEVAKNVAVNIGYYISY